MESKTIRGMAIAASAAVLFASGCAGPGKGAAGESTEAKVACNGANACKGLSECHTANNQCAGENACKGKGFISLSPDDCKKATGGS